MIHARNASQYPASLGCGPNGCSCDGGVSSGGQGCCGQAGSGGAGIGRGSTFGSGPETILQKHPLLTATIMGTLRPPRDPLNNETYWGGPRKTIHLNMQKPAGWVNPWRDVNVVFGPNSAGGFGAADHTQASTNNNSSGGAAVASSIINAASNIYSSSQNAKAAKSAAGPQVAGWINNLNALVATVGNAAAIVQGYKNGTLNYGQASQQLQAQGVPAGQVPQVINAGGNDLASAGNQKLFLYGGLALAAILLLKK